MIQNHELVPLIVLVQALSHNFGLLTLSKVDFLVNQIILIYLSSDYINFFAAARESENQKAHEANTNKVLCVLIKQKCIYKFISDLEALYYEEI